jgi:1-acyl-sn-glycerol-3-phosphate acyltransferase
MIIFRAFIFNVGFFLGTALFSLFGIPVLWRRDWVVRYSTFWSRSILAWLKVAVGLDYEFRGLENLPTVPFILAPKHQSAWDTLILAQLVHDPAIVLKRELLWVPVFGWYLSCAQMIVIDRKAGGAALRKMVTQGRAALAQGRAIAIFPEGTRGPLGGKLPYQPGVAALYAQLGVPMVPVALNSGFYWGRRTFLKRPGRIILQVLPPIEAGLDRRSALAMLEDRIERATDLLLTEAGYAPEPVDKTVEKTLVR